MTKYKGHNYNWNNDDWGYIFVILLMVFGAIIWYYLFK